MNQDQKTSHHTFQKILKLLIVAGCILFVVFLILFSYMASYNHRYQPGIGHIQQLLTYYIEQSEGNFPRSEEELFQKELLRINEKSDHVRYEYNISEDHNDRYWWGIHCFDKFEIAYGVQFVDLEYVDDQLVSRHDGKPVVLVKCPYKRFMSDRYERGLNKSLYEALRKAHSN